MKILNFKFQIRATILIAYVICFMFHVSSVKAQQISLSIAPPVLEVLIKPGKSILIAFDVASSGDPSMFSAKVLPIEGVGEEGEIKIKSAFHGPVRFNLENSEIKFDTPFFLKDRSHQQLLLKIRVPDETEEGDYYYALLVSSNPPETPQGNPTTHATATIAANILITVTQTGQTQIKGKIAQFDTLAQLRFNLFGKDYRVFESSELVPVVLILENQGKNLIKAEGEITLTGNFGEKAKFNIFPQNILRQSQRLVEATPSALIDCDRNRAKNYCKRPVSLLIPGFFIGRYQLTSTINFGEGSPTISTSINFLAIPVKLILAAVISLIIIIFIVKNMRD